MITRQRQQEIAEQYAATMERYLDKQWIDSDCAESVAENEEERAFIRERVIYSVVPAFTFIPEHDE